MDHVMLSSNLEEIGISNPSEEDLKTNQYRVINSVYNLEEIKSILVNKGLITNKSIRDTEDGCQATIAWTSASWGEKFSIRKLSIVDSYEISSKSLSTFLMIDNGKNLKNVVKIERALAS